MSGLVCRDVVARYRHGGDVLHGVDLEGPHGAITALIGPNGSGKSTLLKAIVGIVRARGSVVIDGDDARAMTAAERARRVAYVPQRSLLSAPLPVHVVVAQGRFTHRHSFARMRDEDRAAVQSAMADADVEHLACRPFTELSGGEAQRVLIARALATGASVVLLDEPTSSQDVRHALELHAVLGRLRERETAIVACLHDLSEVRGLADRAVLLDAGRVHAAGPAAEIVSNEHVAQVYGVEIVDGAGLGYRMLDRTGGPS
ncbi:MAG: ABC transporter ATP-binding protein [Planctomycetota bacterium]